MMEEPIGINIDPNPLPSTLNIQLIDHPNGLFGLTRRCPVGIKVVTTQKITTGRPHAIDVQRPMIPGNPGFQKGWPCLTV
jgi:hypothetical protein